MVSTGHNEDLSIDFDKSKFTAAYTTQVQTLVRLYELHIYASNEGSGGHVCFYNNI